MKVPAFFAQSCLQIIINVGNPLCVSKLDETNSREQIKRITSPIEYPETIYVMLPKPEQMKFGQK